MMRAAVLRGAFVAAIAARAAASLRVTSLVALALSQTEAARPKQKAAAPAPDAQNPGPDYFVLLGVEGTGHHYWAIWSRGLNIIATARLDRTERARASFSPRRNRLLLRTQPSPPPRMYPRRARLRKR